LLKGSALYFNKKEHFSFLKKCIRLCNKKS
jgi:hypothetical protein